MKTRTYLRGVVGLDVELVVNLTHSRESNKTHLATAAELWQANGRPRGGRP